jgi:plasmid stabilization system protein ParE
MTFRVIIEPRAEREILEAVRWKLERSKSPASVLRWSNGLRAKIATLKKSPLRCPVDPDSEAYGEEVRLLIYGKRHRRYRVLFTIRGDAVHVLTVRHSAQRGLGEEEVGAEE